MTRSDMSSARWAVRWADALGHELLVPRLEGHVSRSASLCGVMFYAQSFVLRQGWDPADFIGPKMEAMLATTLQSSALVSTVPFRTDGIRHSGAITVIWADTHKLPNDFEWSLDRDGRAAEWVWQHRINEAFDALGWARPDMDAARLTWSRDLVEWELTLRLYGAVVPTNVQERWDTLRQLLGADKISVTAGRRSVTIRLAAPPIRPN